MGTEAAAFATKVGYSLEHPGFRFLNQIVLKGRLPLSEVTTVKASCQFEFHEHWKILPPKLRCDEAWIRCPGGAKNLDWHIYADRSLCYVFPKEWRDTIAQIEERHGTRTALQVAPHYLLQNARWLLNCHLVAYRQRLTEWPKAWNQWPHGYEEALKSYERGRRRI